MNQKLILILLALLAPVFSIRRAQAVDCVWSGAGANALFSNPANWSSGGVPKSTDPDLEITFPTNGTISAVVDIPGLKVRDLDFHRDGFQLRGANGTQMTLVGSTDEWYSEYYPVVSVRVTNLTVHSSLELILSNRCVFSMPGFKYCFGLGGSKLCNTSFNRVDLFCRLSGSGSFRPQGLGLVTLAGPLANTYTGRTFAEASLVLDKPYAVAAIPGDLELSAWYDEDIDDSGRQRIPQPRRQHPPPRRHHQHLERPPLPHRHPHFRRRHRRHPPRGPRRGGRLRRAHQNRVWHPGILRKPTNSMYSSTTTAPTRWPEPSPDSPKGLPSTSAQPSSRSLGRGRQQRRRPDPDLGSCLA